MPSLTRIRLAIAITLLVPTCLLGENAKPELKSGIIVGTAVDVNGDPVPNASVELKSLDSDDPRVVTTRESGAFEFRDVPPGVPYEIIIRAPNFSEWNSSDMTLEPGQFKLVTGIKLEIRPEVTRIDVTYDPVQVATEQLKVEEHQRVFGIVPNFYVSYENNPAPLTAKMKFQLALKTSIDPVTAAGVLFIAGARQAGDSPKFGQGWDAYAELDQLTYSAYLLTLDPDLAVSAVMAAIDASMEDLGSRGDLLQRTIEISLSQLRLDASATSDRESFPFEASLYSDSSFATSKRASSLKELTNGNPILVLDSSARIAFVLTHVLGYSINGAAAMAQISEKEYLAQLRKAYVQLASPQLGADAIAGNMLGQVALA